MARKPSKTRPAPPKGLRPASRNPVYGTIKRDEVYTLDQFIRLTGLGASAIRDAERSGLETAFIGNRKQISGEAWLEFIKKRRKEKSPLKTGIKGS